jgi:8-oxo-dGTP diphosphatase
MSFRLAAYAVCLESDRVLLTSFPLPDGRSLWTLPGGKVEHGEDPLDAVLREVVEETGCDATVERLLGVDSRMIPVDEMRVPGLLPHQKVGIFYQARITGGQLRPEAGARNKPAWTPASSITSLRRSSHVDIGLALARTRPANGHVPPVPVGGLIMH